MASNDKYKQAGVDIDLAESLVKRIKPMARSTHRKGVMGKIGGFGALFSPKLAGYTDPVLVSGTDGVGTKLKVAWMTNKHDTVGIDLVAMCVNDIVTSGAEPLFFLDYFATGKLDPDVGAAVIKGIAEGCRQAGCALIGGETAEMPGFYGPGEYDLAGFAVGAVERGKILDGSKIKPGDTLIGMASSGIHSNGLSLARKIFFERMKLGAENKIKGLRLPVGREILRPTRIYVKSVLDVAARCKLKAAAHITGGGITDNLPRVLPKGLSAKVDTGAWNTPSIFRIIAGQGDVSAKEMYRTFNMGVGMILVVAGTDAKKAIERVARAGEKPYVIGEVISKSGAPGVIYDPPLE